MLGNDPRYDSTIVPDYVDQFRKIYKNLEYLSPEKYEYISRYKYTKRLSDKNNIDYHETYNMKKIPETSSDKYFKVDNTTINRLDIISYNFYGFSIYWWIIAMANDLFDPFNIPLGTILRIPPMTSLYMDGSVLSNE